MNGEPVLFSELYSKDSFSTCPICQQAVEKIELLVTSYCTAPSVLTTSGAKTGTGAGSHKEHHPADCFATH
jgi:hypothetical protein